MTVTAWLLLVCFLLSGMSGLLYEVVWTRMLTQFIGNTTYAIATVLTAFMGGLALGSYAFGRIADRWARHLNLYALLEGGIGLYALAVPWLFQVAQQAYLALFRLSEFSFAIFSLATFLLCALVLLIPTLLMGATLPVLSRWFVTSPSEVGRKVGYLYSVNTLGAVAGCALAGYLLIPALGLRRTIYLGAAVNLLVAGAALLLDRLGTRHDRAPAGVWDAARTPATRTAVPDAPGVAAAPVGAGPGPEPPGAPGGQGRVVLLGFAVSGFVAMLYENAWSRILTLVIGSSTYAFTTMLTTFLVGLALGSALYGRAWGLRPATLAAFGLLELVIGLSNFVTLPLFEQLPLLFLRLYQGFSETFQMFLGLQLFLSALVMLVPTLLFGMTFPLVLQLFTQRLYTLGHRVGTAYAANTVGAILGAFSGGFLLIPALGLQRTVSLAVALNLLTGLALIAADPRRTARLKAALAVPVTAVLAAGLLLSAPWDKHLLTSGVVIYPDIYTRFPLTSLTKEIMRQQDLLYYREGLTATISVHKDPGVDYLFLKTNGKTDASDGDTFTQLMTGYLPLLFHPRAERVLIIGLGSGMTAKAVATFPVKAIDVVEIEPAMVEAARFFAERNGHVLADPRVRMLISDGRNYVLAAREPYDVIISEPSNPWIAGIASLFTREFYEAVRARLRPGGVFFQWFQLYGMAPEDVAMVARTVHSVFPTVTVWQSDGADLFLLAPSRPLKLHYGSLKAEFERNAALRADLALLGLPDPFALSAFLLLDEQAVPAYAAQGELNTDDTTRLEFTAPRSLGRPTTNLNFKLLQPHRSPVTMHGPRLADGLPTMQYYLSRGYQAASEPENALPVIEAALAARPGEARFHRLRAELLQTLERADEAATALRRALALDPAAGDGDGGVLELLTAEERLRVHHARLRRGVGPVAAHLGAGDEYRRLGRIAEAEHHYREAARLRPADGRAELRLGQLALERGAHREAVTHFEAARAKGVDTAELNGGLAEGYRALGDCRRAVPGFERALRQELARTAWRLGLGRCLASLGEPRAAIQRFREVLALEPGNAEAWQALRALGQRL